VAPEAERDVGWQARAVEQYDRSLPARRRDLRWDLAARVLALTGRRISPEDVYADDSMAVAGVDGATFRLHLHDGLVLVRHCDYCGIGHFESPEIKDLADLGYALSAWLPLHEDCENHAAEDLADW
jgi:hypothetical protein